MHVGPTHLNHNLLTLFIDKYRQLSLNTEGASHALETSPSLMYPYFGLFSKMRQHFKMHFLIRIVIAILDLRYQNRMESDDDSHNASVFVGLDVGG